MDIDPLQQLRLLIFDVDGVLSRQTIPLGSDGVPTRTANIHDGYAMQLAVKRGLRLAILSGAKTETLRVRYSGLGLTDIHLGVAVKSVIYEQLLEQYGLTDAQVLYMGDDIPDLPVLERVGVAACPADAAAEVKAVCHYISPRNGGEGAARDVLEQVLRAQGLWMNDDIAFGW